MHKWRHGTGLTVLILVALLITLSSSVHLSRPLITVAQDVPDLQVDLDVKVNAMPDRSFVPIAYRGYLPDWPQPLQIDTGSDAFARGGSWLRYEVTYENPGPGTSAPVDITLELPEEVEYCGYCNEGWTHVGGRSYARSDGPLAAGERRTAVLAARVPEHYDRPGITEASSQVTVHSGGEYTAQQTFTIAATFVLGPSGHNPMGLAVDPDRDLVYIGIASTGQLAIVDPTQQTITLVWDPLMGSQTQGVAYLNDKIYMAHPDIGAVSVIDADPPYQLVRSIYTPPNTQPFGIAAANDRVYVSLFSTDEVAVIDATTDTLIATGVTGGHPCLIGALDDRAYVANHSHFYGILGLQAAELEPAELLALAEEYAAQNPNDTGVTVVYRDGRTERILVGEIGFFGVAVDPTRNRVYVTRRDLGREGLYVLDATTHELIRHVPLSKPYSVAVNPNTNHVFVVMAQPEVNKLFVFDGDQDYALIRIEDLLQQSQWDGMMNGGQGVGVLSHRLLGDWAYVANYGHHSATSIPDLPGTLPEYDPPIGAPFVRTWVNDTNQPGHRPLGLPLGEPSYRPFVQQDFEYGFPGGLTKDVLYLHDVMTGTDQIYEFKVFIEPDAPGARTLMMNTTDEVSVAWNQTLDQKVAENSSSDRLRFGNYLAPGTPPQPSFFRTYMRFPLGAIPSGSTINSARLQMWVYDERYPGGGSLNAGAYRVTSDSWSEAGLSNTATWTWATLPGFNSVPESVVNVSTLHQWYYWDVTGLVQAWVDGSAPNYGLMVSGNPEGAVSQAMGAYSRGGVLPARGPVLLVDYTPPGSAGPISPGYDGTHGHWLRFPDMWNPSMPEYACNHVIPGYYDFEYGVRYGFGMVWCTLHYSPNPAYRLYQLGKPFADERYGSGASQRFQNGMVFWSPDADYPNLSGTLYVAYYEQGWWHAYPY